MAFQANTSLSKHLALEDLSGSSVPTLEGSIFASGGVMKILSPISASGEIEGTSLDIEGHAAVGGNVVASGDVKGVNLSGSNDLQLNNAGQILMPGLALDRADLLKLDAITNGTVAASKAVVVDSDKDASGFRNVTATGAFIIGNANMNETDLEKLDGITNGTVAAAKAVVVNDNKDASGFRHISSSNGGNISAGDGGAFIIGNASMDETDLEKLDGITNGTAAANKALVLDANKAIGTITELTASRAKIGVLDVETINSITTTQTSLEILDNTIVASSGSNSANADGGGLQIGGTIDDSTDGVASLLYRNSGTKLEASIGSSTILTIKPTGVDVAGVVSGSGALQGSGVDVALKVEAGGNVEAGGDVKGVNLSGSNDLQLNNAGQILMPGLALNRADLLKLDAITDGTVAANKAVVVDNNKDASGFRHLSASNGGIITAGDGGAFVIGSANMSEADLEKLDGITNGTVAASKAVVVDSDKDASGFRNVTATGAFIIGNANMDETDLEKLDGITNGTGAASKALVLNAASAITTGVSRFVASGITASAGAVVHGLGTGKNLSVHAGATAPTTSNFLAAFMSGAAGSPHSLNLNAGVAGGANGTILSFLSPGVGDLGNLKFSGGLMIMSSSADLSLRAPVTSTVGVGGRLLHVSGAMEVDGNAQFDGSVTVGSDGSGGTITANTYATHSDRELKTGIEPMTSALDKVMMLEPVTYEMKGAPGKADLGFIAQDVAKIVPEICVVDGQGIGRAIDYGRMSAVLAGAVKAQQTQIDELKAVIAKLQK